MHHLRLNVGKNILKILVNISSNKIELGNIKQAKEILTACKSNVGDYNLSLIQIKEGNLKKGWKNYDYGISNGARKVRDIDFFCHFSYRFR